MVTQLDDKITIGDILENNFLIENANLSLLIHGIRKAIPKRIKEFLKTKTNYVSKNGLVKIGNKWKSINSFKTKEIYNEYISTKIAKPTAITTLENNLNLQFEDDLWKSFFIRNRQYTKNRYFRSWQFKILHGIHNTRKNLKKMENN
jgi:hypothetical protein